jgi:hypothetical protein
LWRRNENVHFKQNLRILEAAKSEAAGW